MGIIYFDICAIPIFLIILFVCYSRKMTKGNANILFLFLIYLSLFSAIADLTMEIADNMVPLSKLGLFICTISTYAYLIIRNATNVVLLLFLIHLTKTTFILRKKIAKITFSAPYICILLMLIQNPFTNLAFTVTAESGYARGPLMYAFYGIALIYGLVGLSYCIYCRKYLSKSKWASLMSIYVLGHIAVFIQFFYPSLLLEMFSTAIGLMIVMFAIMRPEERMDTEVGMLSWMSYQTDLKNIITSEDHLQIVVIRIPNSRETRNFLGEHGYNAYLLEIGNSIRSIHWDKQYNIELYCERPGNIYMIANFKEKSVEEIREKLLSAFGENLSKYDKIGVGFDPAICLIKVPEDLQKQEDIIVLGHNFHKASKFTSKALLANDILQSLDFKIEAKIEEILDNAIKEGNIEMYYQPILDVKTGEFSSAEALARLKDPKYGMISPGIFISAAEAYGKIIPIGDEVLDQVFRFVSENDFDKMGISYIEVNLSVAQCMESSFPDKIKALQEKYNTDPRRINFEITETTYGDVSDIIVKNVSELMEMGYTFALDDYGTGYSNIKRISHIPFKLIKIDKSLVDDSSSENGKKILEHTIRMMQSIGKELVIEGAETADVVEAIKRMNCDHIQGFYYSHPLPKEDYIKFVQKNCKK